MKNDNLTDDEIHAALIIRNCLVQHHVGKDHAVSTPHIINGMRNNSGIKLSAVLVRKIINWLRNSDQCIALCSTTAGGYYIAATDKELEECCDALHDRWVSQYETERSLRRQLERIRNAKQQALNI